MTPKDEANRAMAMTLAFDVASAMFAMAVAVSWRWVATAGAPPNAWQAVFVAVITFALAALVSFFMLSVHRQVWRHSGWSDAVRIIQAVALTALLFLPVQFFWNRLVGFPRSSLAIACIIWVVLLFSGRMVALSRSTNQPFQIFSARVRSEAPITLLVADSASAADVLRESRRMEGGSPVRILGLIELDGAESGRAIRGIPVMGALQDLGKAMDLLSVRYGKTPWIAVSGKARGRHIMAEVLKAASARKAEVMALGSSTSGTRIQPVRPADLLARPERQLDITPVREIATGSRIFVTGAGGTIGSELARQLAKLNPHELSIYDASEYNLYEIDLLLHREHPNLSIRTSLGDVRDRTRLMKSLKEARPDVVLHAAALKHVPLMERNVCEAILTNVGGVIQSAQAAIDVGVKRFVFISTDKAVDPDNVMGATKRLAELALARIIDGTDMSVSMVRFGNVLGSSGSVVPLFERQIAAGGPVTLTDSDATRYFMTVEEASSLVLQAAARNGSPGTAVLYVLDMGEPVRIRSLAEAMIRLKGLVPDRDIEIRVTGLRAGEKLHEVLTYEHEQVETTEIEGLLKVGGQAAPNGVFEDRLESLLEAAARRDRDTALRLLAELVPGYRPDATD